MIVHWNRQEIGNWDEALKAAIAIESPERAEAFLLAFEKAGCQRKDVLQNLGYWTGYWEREKAQEALDKLVAIFGTAAQHPVFGKTLELDPKKAFEKGKKLGEIHSKTGRIPTPEELDKEK